MLTVLYIGDKLRETRKRALLTQQQLAEKSGVGVTTIIRIERNQVEPQARTIRKLAEALDVEPFELLKGENDGKAGHGRGDQTPPQGRAVHGPLHGADGHRIEAQGHLWQDSAGGL